MVNVQPYKLNLGPGSALLDANGKAADLSIFCGADWTLTVPFYGPDGVTPINVTSPQMQIRAVADETSALIITPTLTPVTNTITISIPGSATKLLTARSGAYTLHAVRADTSAPVWLMYGNVTIVPPTTILT
jgi:hypothetical protein